MTHTFTVTITTDYTNLDAPTAEALANEIENHFTRLRRFGVEHVEVVLNPPAKVNAIDWGWRND